MALTINDFFGAETGGLEEASSTSGSPDATEAIIVRSGSRSLKLASGDIFSFTPFSKVADAGNDYIWGFAFYKDSNFTSTDNLISFQEGASFSCQVHLSNLGELLLIGITTTLDTSSVLTNNQWHYVEIYFQHQDSGNWEWFIDGVPEGSGSAADFDQGGTLDTIRMTGQTGANVYLDDVDVMSGATASSDRLGPVEVYMKQGAQTGTTPDTSDLADTVLDEGTWQLASETPLNEQSQSAAASYTGGAAAGVVYADGSGDKLGPAGDDRFLGTTIKAIKGIWRLARSGGGSTTQVGEIGNDGGAAADLESTPDLDITTGYINYFYITETAATLPSLTEHAAIGMSKDGGGQDLDNAEMWVMLLVVPAAPDITALSDSDLEYPDQNYFVGPFEIT